MGFTLTSSADQSVHRPRQCLLAGTLALTRPIGITEYQLVRALPEPLAIYLPSIEQIEAELGRIEDKGSGFLKEKC